MAKGMLGNFSKDSGNTFIHNILKNQFLALLVNNL